MINDLKIAIDNETWNIDGNIETETLIENNVLYIDICRNPHAHSIMKYIEKEYGVRTCLIETAGDIIIACSFGGF